MGCLQVQSSMMNVQCSHLSVWLPFSRKWPPLDPACLSSFLSRSSTPLEEHKTTCTFTVHTSQITNWNTLTSLVRTESLHVCQHCVSHMPNTATLILWCHIGPTYLCNMKDYSRITNYNVFCWLIIVVSHDYCMSHRPCLSNCHTCDSSETMSFILLLSMTQPIQNLPDGQPSNTNIFN